MAEVIFWVNIYRFEDGTARVGGANYSTRDAADLANSRTRITCEKVIIEVKEGEGLTYTS